MTYRFLGTASQVGSIGLSEYGQKFELDPAFAAMIVHKVAFIPDAEFEAVGFTEQELAENSNSNMHAEAKPEFLAKKRAALDKYFELLSKPSAAAAESHDDGGEV